MIIVLASWYINSGVMMIVLASCEVDREHDVERASQTKDYNNGVGCFSVNIPSLMSKSKDWLTESG